MRQLSIGHLSHGITETGGYRHEQQLMLALVASFSVKGIFCKQHTQRIRKYFSGLTHLTLQWWSFTNASFDINIVTVRCALSAILRNLFNHKKVLIVLHNHDAGDHNGMVLSVYHRLLFWMLGNLSFRNVAIVTVAPFWVKYFEQKINNNGPVFLYPNLFDTKAYDSYRGVSKNKQIHLGQFSLKNDKRVFELASLLKQEGYHCYFSTLVKQEQGVFDNYEVRFGSFEQYLTDMANSKYTVAFTAVNEGWNRVAHESLLVGTPVVGVNKAGLGDLLVESGSAVATNERDFFNTIINEQQHLIPSGFLKKYDTSTAPDWVKPLALFCEPE